ncbi:MULTISPECIES: 2,5-diamino-6-(ribosylamino)-4(3H)-pyrimidinone 5'-phosphate reductase [Halolamina]|uniref:2,5-diamino-6-(ribosylamino)-4(3H)-pyrimidinone 5'-phosphate reductase n=1 Tax=Halolamina pelagica TaxID=699431 RepID=A0A1I5MIB8_9EURY|nr:MULTISPECIES: 2,5-diamino-6-(ribosylamino)-4(3H)-pyrimidinone 5'-phosphate reductase [Halolamina]NHX36043.1 2,5-diamino-6-(ribosylamino)-4(3H)-pyrimidinone 5'-phosphate reductase [Halolamina sp. R1-12]SFP09388.1 2,5-diamino-6-(ribosylamino)-4(3H)-pyrimidinone 5'-phosphate reductase [Halolamina pelagica]
MHVHVNAAESVDGKLSTREREQVAISGPADFDRMDALRAESDGVLVGVGTVLADDPSLTVKDDERRDRRERDGEPATPARIVADSRARTPPDAEILGDAAATYVLVSEDADEADVAALSAAGATVVTAGSGRVDLPAAFERLEDHGVERLLVEGGGELIFSLFDAGLVDRLTVYVGPVVIGGRDAPTLADGEGFTDPDAFPSLSLEDVERLDDGVVLTYDAGAEEQ